MQYRHLRNFEERVSLLGYGCMRFPVREDDPSNIVEEEAEKLILSGLGAAGCKAPV